MENIYAAMLLHKAGKQIDEASMEAVLKAAGITADKAMVRATITALKGIDIEKTIKEALAMPIATTAAAAPSAAPKEDKKKAIEEEQKSEEEAAAGLGALFG